MARTVVDMDMFQRYLIGVMDTVNSIPDNRVAAVVLAVAGGVIWRKRGKIKVWERDGNMGNRLWVHIGEKLYYFTYNHDKHQIVVRDGGKSGPEVTRFDNSNTVEEVLSQIQSL